MPALTFIPHEIIRDRDTGKPIVLHKHDYIGLSNEGENIYVQDGHIYLGGGDPIPFDDAPDWFFEAYAKLTPEARKSCGLPLPQDRIKSVSELPGDFVKQFKDLPPEIRAELLGQAPTMPEKPPKVFIETSDTPPEKSLVLDDPEPPQLRSWTCDQCGEEMALKLKGVHKAHHARRKVRA